MEVTVLLVVHNCELFIHECVRSILNQVYTDFELLVIDDCSTDSTLSIIRSFDDKRIRLVCMSENNYINSLNVGLRMAEGKYIARMDGDDVMLPCRLEKQVNVMRNHPDIAVCSSWYKCFGLYDEVSKGNSCKISHPLLILLRGNIMAHPTTMIRKSFFVDHNIIYKEYLYAEDYKLWSDVAIAGGSFYVIPEVLLEYRCSTSQISYQNHEEQTDTAFLIKSEILEHLISKHSVHDRDLMALYDILISFNEKEELSSDTIFSVFTEILKFKLLRTK